MKKNYSNSTNFKSQADKVAETFSQMMISRMEEMKGKLWQQGWIAGKSLGAAPQNLTGREYSGGNSFFLQLYAAAKQFQAPIYMTFLQAEKEKLSIKKDEKSIPIVYWDLVIKNKDGKNVEKDEYEKLSTEEKKSMDVQPLLKAYNVFNIDQTNLKEVDVEKYNKLVDKFHVEPKIDKKGMYENAALDRMFEKQEWVCPIHVDKPERSAYYNPSMDYIAIPMKEQFKQGNTPQEIFKDGMAFYGTALHEMAHSTGHETRLNRTKGNRFGDAKYAKEELVAELTSAMIGNSMGFDKRILNNNAAYLDSWINVLKQEPKFILSVMADVNKASKMILDKVERQKVELGKTQGDNIMRNEKQDIVFGDASIFKLKNGDFAIRASVNGVSLGTKTISSTEAHSYFLKDNSQEKNAFMKDLLHKTYSTELKSMEQNKVRSLHL